MSTVVGLHPDIIDIAALPPGWIARRSAPGQPWDWKENP
jgi:hypothetical protein